jgi:hypothetical protein
MGMQFVFVFGHLAFRLYCDFGSLLREAAERIVRGRWCCGQWQATLRKED